MAKITITDAQSPFLASQHQKELFAKRGLSREWCQANCKSITKEEASALLGYTAHSDGIWLEGENLHGQFKPDTAWGEPGKRPPKYRSPSGGYDAILPAHPANPRYWHDTEVLKKQCYVIDGTPCIVISEGVFKAIAGCAIGVPTVSLSGVEMGLTSAAADVQGKRYLVPSLEKLARAGFGFIHAFDADAATKPAVIEAQRKLASQLAKFNAPQWIVTGLWSCDQGKGMDDYIQKNGEEAFRREVLAKAVVWEAWEAQFRKEDPKEKNLPPRAAAKQLVERYRNHWKYDLGRQTWRHWEKVWGAVPDEVFTQTVYRDLEGMKDVNYSTFSYVENVVKFLKTELLEKEWITFNRMEWIAFNDCVLEVKTGKAHAHAPGFGFTSCLEHDYPKFTSIDPASTLLDGLRIYAPTFYSWAMYAQKGDPLKVMKLLAICNGTLKFRFFDLQMFVLLIGVPGAGKGTFARLLELMVGKPNYASAKLHKLGEDNILAAIIDKQLVICPDEKKAGNDYSGLLSLTGGDSIPYRPIYRPHASGRFFGAVVLVANTYPFYGDTMGIARRECLVNFDTPIQNRDTSVEKKIQGEVGAIMALALSLPDDQVTEFLTGTGASAIPDFKRQAWLNKVENDSVALFMEECITQAGEESYLLLGGKGENAYTLYGAYLAMCEDNNSRSPFSRQTFRGHFLELCKELGWNEVVAKRKENGWRVYGIRLKNPGEAIRHVSDLLAGCKPGTSPIDPEALSSEDAVAPVGLHPLLPHTEEERPHLHPSPPEAMTGEYDPVVNNDISLHGACKPTESTLQGGSGSTKNGGGLQDGTPPQTIQEQIREAWEDVAELGTLILSLPEQELREVMATSSQEGIAHIKNAANKAWKPGLNRDACYKGERVEIWEAGQGRDIKVKSKGRTGSFPVRRADLTPWLGG